jgi:hypothetical protein
MQQHIDIVVGLAAVTLGSCAHCGHQTLEIERMTEMRQ